MVIYHTVVRDNGAPIFDLEHKDAQLILFVDDKFSFDLQFTPKFKNGEEKTAKLNESLIYQSFYSNENIYKVADQPVCTLLDIAFQKEDLRQLLSHITVVCEIK